MSRERVKAHKRQGAAEAMIGDAEVEKGVRRTRGRARGAWVGSHRYHGAEGREEHIAELGGDGRRDAPDQAHDLAAQLNLHPVPSLMKGRVMNVFLAPDLRRDDGADAGLDLLLDHGLGEVQGGLGGGPGRGARGPARRDELLPEEVARHRDADVRGRVHLGVGWAWGGESGHTAHNDVVDTRYNRRVLTPHRPATSPVSRQCDQDLVDEGRDQAPVEVHDEELREHLLRGAVEAERVPEPARVLEVVEGDLECALDLKTIRTKNIRSGAPAQ